MKGLDPQLVARMIRVGLSEEDLDESFIRAGGNGGQNVNKVATCVLLVHRPSRLRVRSEEARSQGLNRVAARLRLVEKMETRVKEAKEKKKQEAEKKKRQKRAPSKGAKRRNVEKKRRRGETKRMRGRISGSGD